MPLRSSRPTTGPSVPSVASPKSPAPRAPATPPAPTPPAPSAPADASAMTGPRPDHSKLIGALPPAPPQVGGPLAAAFDGLRAPGGPAQARVLSDGLDAWNARWEMVGAARTSIDADYFSLEKDVFGFAFLGALLKKQLAGVPVRVMTDAMADTFGQRGFKMPLRGQDYLQELVNHGGKAYIYHPIWKRPFEALKGDYSVLASNHDKVLVVDGRRGLTGGRNIGIDYFASPADRKGAWRDMDVELDGAATAAGLTAAMDAELANEGAAVEVSKDLLGNWSKKDLQLIGAAELMDLWLHDPAFTDAEKAALRAAPEGKQALVRDLVARAVKRLREAVPEGLRREPSDADLAKLHELGTELVDQLEARGSAQKYLAGRPPERSSEAKILDQTSTAGKRINEIAPALKTLVDAAQKRIVIENPYVVLTEEMMVSLEKASARGVQIDILTNSPLSTDSDVTQAFFLEDWPHILARCPNARIFVATGDRKFHSKSAVVDGDQAFVSTYNLDLLSGYVNSEVGAVIKSREVASDLLAAFDADKADPANGFLEYTIQRDAQGKAIVKDGKPVPAFGPEDHLPAKVLEEYASKRQRWGHTLRENLPYFEPLRHPALPDNP